MQVEPSADASDARATRRFLRPADYYSSATPTRAFPRWVSLGCGGAALVILIIVFAAGIYLSRGGFGEVVDLSFGMTMGELRGMFQPDVTAAQKTALENEIKALRENVRGGAAVARLDPVLQAMKRSMKDRKVHAAEVEEITDAARKFNSKPRGR